MMHHMSWSSDALQQWYGPWWRGERRYAWEIPINLLWPHLSASKSYQSSVVAAGYYALDYIRRVYGGIPVLVKNGTGACCNQNPAVMRLSQLT